MIFTLKIYISTSAQLLKITIQKITIQNSKSFFFIYERLIKFVNIIAIFRYSLLIGSSLWDSIGVEKKKETKDCFRIPVIAVSMWLLTEYSSRRGNSNLFLQLVSDKHNLACYVHMVATGSRGWKSLVCIQSKAVHTRRKF